MVRVKTVTEIGSKFYRPRCGRVADSSRNRTEAVSVLPRDLNALLKFLNAHSGWTKARMLAVVELPILREDAILGQESLVERRIRKRRDHGEARQINFRLHREFRRLEKNIRLVMVEAENKTALKRDAVFMQPFDHPDESLRRIETFAAFTKALRRDGFQAPQQSFAGAARGQCQQLQVIGQQNCGQAIPLKFQWNQRDKQPQRIAAVGDKFNIHKDDFLRAV